jgi:hypothetical protein
MTDNIYRCRLLYIASNRCSNIGSAGPQLLRPRSNSGDARSNPAAPSEGDILHRPAPATPGVLRHAPPCSAAGACPGLLSEPSLGVAYQTTRDMPQTGTPYRALRSFMVGVSGFYTLAEHMYSTFHHPICDGWLYITHHPRVMVSSTTHIWQLPTTTCRSEIAHVLTCGDPSCPALADAPSTRGLTLLRHPCVSGGRQSWWPANLPWYLRTEVKWNSTTLPGLKRYMRKQHLQHTCLVEVRGADSSS